MKRHARHSPLARIWLAVFSLFLAAPIQAQNGTESDIIFAAERKEQAREQLRGILSQYDVDSWIFTRVVNINLGVDPHSHPILTLNARNLNEDLQQLSTFLHEQAHWLPSVENRKAAIKELQKVYPDIPGVPEEGHIPAGTEVRIYDHLIVAWVELDAMSQLVGKEKARKIFKEKMQELTEEPYSTVEKGYRWYNTRVLTDTRKIGAILARHDLVITPEKGIVLATEEE